MDGNITVSGALNEAECAGIGPTLMVRQSAEYAGQGINPGLARVSAGDR